MRIKVENEKIRDRFLSKLSNTHTKDAHRYAINKLINTYPNKLFSELTETDMDNFELKLKSDGKAESTVFQYCLCLKIFLSGTKRKKYWKEPINNNLSNWIVEKPKSMTKSIILSDLPTQEEIQKLIDNCWCTRDKAIISVLTQSGFRISELLSMRIRDVEFQDGYATISCTESKTTIRKVDIAMPIYLRDWIRELNQMGYSDRDYIWINIIRNKGKKLCSNAIREMLKELKKVTKLNKKLTPHVFRKVYGTFVYNNLSTIRAKQIMGHKSSSMMTIYCGTDNNEARKELREKLGITRKEEIKALITPKDCPYCHGTIPDKSCVCPICKHDITPEKIFEREHREQKKMKELVETVRDKVLVDILDKLEINKEPLPIRLQTRIGNLQHKMNMKLINLIDDKDINKLLKSN